MTSSLQFNKAATDLLQGRQGGKLRMEIRDGTMFIRPTDRKAGPHVLTEYQEGSRGSIMVSLEDKQVEKLGATLENKSQFNVVKDKYGWFALRSGDGEDGADAKATIKVDGSAAPAEPDSE